MNGNFLLTLHFSYIVINSYFVIHFNQKAQGRLKWTCTTEVDITNVRCFNLVAFPRKETFLVGQSQTELSSSVDKFIKISIQEKTFTHPKGKVSLEVGCEF